MQNSTRATRPRSILLFGEALVDCFPDREILGGAPYNVTHHLQVLGGSACLAPRLISRIGLDPRGERILAAMRAAGLEIGGIQSDALHPTGIVRVDFDPLTNAHRFEIVPEQAWDFIDPEMARAQVVAHRPDWIYFGSLAQRGNSRHALSAMLDASTAWRFLDINLREPWVERRVLETSLDLADMVKVNDDELSRLARMFDLEGDDALSQAGHLARRFDLDALLVTCGEQGAYLLDRAGRMYETPVTSPITDLVDTVGAGDGFAAVTLLGLTLGWLPEMLLERAHRFAGAICRIHGAIPADPSFYMPFIRDWGLD